MLFASLRSVPNRIALRQQGRPCFSFSFEEDEEQTQEGRRREKISATPSHCASSTHTSPKLSLWLCFLASAGCWRALLRAPGVACFMSRIVSPFGGARKIDASALPVRSLGKNYTRSPRKNEKIKFLPETTCPVSETWSVLDTVTP